VIALREGCSLGKQGTQRRDTAKDFHLKEALPPCFKRSTIGPNYNRQEWINSPTGTGEDARRGGGNLPGELGRTKVLVLRSEESRRGLHRLRMRGQQGRENAKPVHKRVKSSGGGPSIG